MKDLKLLGFNLTKIQAKRNHNFKGKLEIKTNINIRSIERHELELSKEASTKIDFDFEIDYKDLGKVSLEGEMFIITEPKLMKQLIKGWKEKKIDSDLQVILLNIIVQRASLKAFKIEEELGLPVHVQLPRLKKK